HHIPFFVLREILVEITRNKLLDAEPQLPLFLIDRQYLRFDNLPEPQNILRMVDPFLGADLTHVNHAFDTLGALHERAKFRNAADRTLHHGPDWEILLDVTPRIAQRLLQTEGNPPLPRVDTEDHSLYGLARLHNVTGLLYFLAPGHFGNVNQPFDPWLQLHEGSELHQAGHNPAHPFSYLAL